MGQPQSKEEKANPLTTGSSNTQKGGQLSSNCSSVFHRESAGIKKCPQSSTATGAITSSGCSSSSVAGLGNNTASTVKCNNRTQLKDCHNEANLSTASTESSDVPLKRAESILESQGNGATSGCLLKDEPNSCLELSVDPYSNLKLLRHVVDEILKLRPDLDKLQFFHDLVLPQFYESLMESNNPLIALEITLSLNKLIQNDILQSTWDYVLLICEYIVSKFSMALTTTGSDRLIPDNPFPQQFHELLTSIESLDEIRPLFSHCRCRLFDMIETCWTHRPEASVRRLIKYRTETIVTSNEMRQLKSLLDKFFNANTCSSVRKAALSSMASVVSLYHRIHEESLINTIVIPYLRDIDQETDMEIRIVAVKLLVDLTQSCRNERLCCELLELIKKILDRSMQVESFGFTENNEKKNGLGDTDIDITFAVVGLIAIVKKNLYTLPAAAATTSFNLLITHLNAHYCNNSNLQLSQKFSSVRQEILELLLSIRANALHQVGICMANGHTQFSTYVRCANDGDPLLFDNNIQESPHASGSTSPQLASPPDVSSCDTLSLRCMFNVLLLALDRENDWNILRCLLSRLPHFLQNKAVVYSVDAPRIIDSLCDIFVSLVSERFKLVKENFYNVPNNLMKSEFQTYVYPSLISLIAYHEVLEVTSKKNLVRQLENGFTSQPRQCIPALVLCITEMQDVMVKLIPDIVLSLSKISATVILAVPKLEFLSHLILWPRLSSSFTQDQYMSIFAIVLPYTNHDKFDDYTVTMAYKVISMWFLQCRLPLRKHLVQFIIKGLQANVMQPVEDNAKDDELRKRSGSLNVSEKRSSEVSRIPGATQVPLSPHPSSAVPQSPAPNQHPTSVFSFPVSSSDSHYSSSTSLPARQHRQNANVVHHELIDTCMDLLTKYTIGNCSTVPQKHPVADFLLDRKQSCSWLLGQKIITITTSGCSARASQDGMCEECNQLCRLLDKCPDTSANDEVAHYMAPEKQPSKSLYRSESARCRELDACKDQSFVSARKRHQSELSRLSSVQLNPHPSSRAFDDCGLKGSAFMPGGSNGNLCNCWCQGWAEILIRTPTGNTSWIMRIQNRLNLSSAFTDMNAPDLTRVYSQKDSEAEKRLVESMDSKESSGNYDIRSFSTPPSFKRTSSSPEMERSTGGSSVFATVEISEDVSNPKDETIHTDAIVSDKNSVDAAICKMENHGLSSCANRCMNASVTSPVKTHNSSAPSERKSSFSKSKPKDLSIHLPSALNSDYSNSPSPSPLKPSSPSVSSKTPQKTTPSKLDFISEQQNQEGRRDRRLYTISVMSPAQKAGFRRPCITQKGNDIMPKSGSLNPAFVFLQLYYSTSFSAQDRPVLLPKTEVIDRAVSVLDYISPYETHKIGVVYIGPQQIDDKVAILSNRSGSSRYSAFLKGLGKLIRLKDVDASVTYVGGLSTDGSDGQFAYCWQDNLTQVIFHVATLMPTKENDPQCNEKKRHIGNDFVVIVYNESGEDFNLSTIKGDGQFIYACIVITPMEYHTNLIALQTKSELTEIIGHQESIVLSDNNLPQFVRQLALHANLASVVFKARSQTPSSPYVSNSVERLRKIKGVLQKVNEYMCNLRCSGFTYGPTPSPNKPTFAGSTSADYEAFSTNQAGAHYSFPDDFTNYV